jgi:hypothetical protein
VAIECAENGKKDELPVVETHACVLSGEVWFVLPLKNSCGCRLDDAAALREDIK